MKKQIRLFLTLITTIVMMCCVLGCGDSNLEISGSTEPVTVETESKAAALEEDIPEVSSSVESEANLSAAAPPQEFNIAEIPAFSGSPYITVNNNTPYFQASDLTTSSYEYYSELDALGRCGTVMASIGQDLMPTEERGTIGSVKPTGWHTVKYDFVDGKYLYNRCHLIGFQLSGENANTRNLITGTRYMNVDGMLPFENMVADYVKETGNHVLYRVTPVFEGNNLLASGVLMEAESVEDSGTDILFCVYCYNAQPQVTIDYATGESSANGEMTSSSSTAATDTAAAVGAAAAGTAAISDSSSTSTATSTYIINTNTGKFHLPSCYSVSRMKDSNKQEYTGSRDDLIGQGYEPCKNCNP